MNKYDVWIATWVATHDVKNKCAEVTEEMAKVFPELTIVKGYYHCDYPRPHWWLVTTDSKIIDPTISQYSSYGCKYTTWESQITGGCSKCGKWYCDGLKQCKCE